jgi:hypothetical protein
MVAVTGLVSERRLSRASALAESVATEPLDEVPLAA